jgi:HEAT repeats
VPLTAREAEALRPSPPGTVKVIHLHGRASDSSSIVLPGKPTRLLTSDDVFKTNVRALMEQTVVMYLGFSFGPGEFPLRDTLAWLTAVQDVQRHILVLPADQASPRGAELAELAAMEHVDLVLYDASRGHDFVTQLALQLAPRADATGAVAPAIADSAAPVYVLPALVGEQPGESLDELERKILGAEHGWGDPFVTPDELVAAGRALVLAAPGMGKTELVRMLAHAPECSPSLLASARDLGACLDDDLDEPARAVARTLARGQAGCVETPVPDLAALERASYLFLLDHLDELHPVKRLAAVKAIEAAVDRWPQHRWIVVSRPTPELEAFGPAKFSTYRILPSEAWGATYLAARAIPAERAEWLRESQPGFGALLGIPMFAAGIADRLQEGGALPTTILELFVEVQRDATEREARTHGRDAQDLGQWLTRLAIGLELLGRTEADVSELATVPGHEDLEPVSIRERLVQASLLAKLPRRASFARRTLQEVLCAWAILQSDDPATVLRRVALGEVLGEQHLRGDMEFTIDLVFEAASRAVRSQLFDLDEQRWARTVLANGTVDDGRRALDLLSGQHERRSARFGSFAEGLRSPLQAAVAIAHRWPILLAERRDELLRSLTDPETYRRYNALHLLGANEDPDAETWLPPLISDPAEDVSALAVSMASNWGLRAAVPALQEVATKPGRRHRRQILHALIELDADPQEVLALAALPFDNTLDFAEIADRLEPRLNLNVALEFLNRRTHDSRLWEWFLARTLDRAAASDWTSDRVRRLVEAVCNHNGDPDVARDARLQAVVNDHADVALQAANEALLRRPPAVNGLMMFSSIDARLLSDDDNTAIREGLATAQASVEQSRRPQPIDWEARARQRLRSPVVGSRVDVRAGMCCR